MSNTNAKGSNHRGVLRTPDPDISFKSLDAAITSALKTLINDASKLSGARDTAVETKLTEVCHTAGYNMAAHVNGTMTLRSCFMDSDPNGKYCVQSPEIYQSFEEDLRNVTDAMQRALRGYDKGEIIMRVNAYREFWKNWTVKKVGWWFKQRRLFCDFMKTILSKTDYYSIFAVAEERALEKVNEAVEKSLLSVFVACGTSQEATQKLVNMQLWDKDTGVAVCVKQEDDQAQGKHSLSMAGLDIVVDEDKLLARDMTPDVEPDLINVGGRVSLAPAAASSSSSSSASSASSTTTPSTPPPPPTNNPSTATPTQGSGARSTDSAAAQEEGGEEQQEDNNGEGEQHADQRTQEELFADITDPLTPFPSRQKVDHLRDPEIIAHLKYRTTAGFVRGVMTAALQGISELVIHLDPSNILAQLKHRFRASYLHRMEMAFGEFMRFSMRRGEKLTLFKSRFDRQIERLSQRFTGFKKLMADDIQVGWALYLIRQGGGTEAQTYIDKVQHQLTINRAFAVYADDVDEDKLTPEKKAELLDKVKPKQMWDTMLELETAEEANKQSARAGGGNSQQRFRHKGNVRAQNVLNTQVVKPPVDKTTAAAPKVQQANQVKGPHVLGGTKQRVTSTQHSQRPQHNQQTQHNQLTQHKQRGQQTQQSNKQSQGKKKKQHGKSPQRTQPPQQKQQQHQERPQPKTGNGGQADRSERPTYNGANLCTRCYLRRGTHGLDKCPYPPNVTVCYKCLNFGHVKDDCPKQVKVDKLIWTPRHVAPRPDQRALVVECGEMPPCVFGSFSGQEGASILEDARREARRSSDQGDGSDTGSDVAVGDRAPEPAMLHVQVCGKGTAACQNELVGGGESAPALPATSDVRDENGAEDSVSEEVVGEEVVEAVSKVPSDSPSSPPEVEAAASEVLVDSPPLSPVEAIADKASAQAVEKDGCASSASAKVKDATPPSLVKKRSPQLVMDKPGAQMAHPRHGGKGGKSKSNKKKRQRRKKRAQVVEEDVSTPPSVDVPPFGAVDLAHGAPISEAKAIIFDRLVKVLGLVETQVVEPLEAYELSSEGRWAEADLPLVSRHVAERVSPYLGAAFMDIVGELCAPPWEITLDSDGLEAIFRSQMVEYERLGKALLLHHPLLSEVITTDHFHHLTTWALDLPDSDGPDTSTVGMVDRIGQMDVLISFARHMLFRFDPKNTLSQDVPSTGAPVQPLCGAPLEISSLFFDRPSGLELPGLDLLSDASTATALLDQWRDECLNYESRPVDLSDLPELEDASLALSPPPDTSEVEDEAPASEVEDVAPATVSQGGTGIVRGDDSPRARSAPDPPQQPPARRPSQPARRISRTLLHIGQAGNVMVPTVTIGNDVANQVVSVSGDQSLRLMQSGQLPAGATTPPDEEESVGDETAVAMEEQEEEEGGQLQEEEQQQQPTDIGDVTEPEQQQQQGGQQEQPQQQQQPASPSGSEGGRAVPSLRSTQLTPPRPSGVRRGPGAVIVEDHSLRGGRDIGVRQSIRPELIAQRGEWTGQMHEVELQPKSADHYDSAARTSRAVIWANDTQLQHHHLITQAQSLVGFEFVQYRGSGLQMEVMVSKMVNVYNVRHMAKDSFLIRDQDDSEHPLPADLNVPVEDVRGPEGQVYPYSTCSLDENGWNQYQHYFGADGSFGRLVIAKYGLSEEDRNPYEGQLSRTGDDLAMLMARTCVPMPILDLIKPLERGMRVEEYLSGYVATSWENHNQLRIPRPYPRLGHFVHHEDEWVLLSHFSIGEGMFTGYYEPQRDNWDWIRVFPDTEEWFHMMDFYRQNGFFGWLDIHFDRGAILYLQWRNKGVDPRKLVTTKYIEDDLLTWALTELGERLIRQIQFDTDALVCELLSHSTHSPFNMVKPDEGYGQLMFATWDVIERERAQLQSFYDSHLLFLQTRCHCGKSRVGECEEKRCTGHRESSAGRRKGKSKRQAPVTPSTREEIHAATEMARYSVLHEQLGLTVDRLREINDIAHAQHDVSIPEDTDDNYEPIVRSWNQGRHYYDLWWAGIHVTPRVSSAVWPSRYPHGINGYTNVFEITGMEEFARVGRGERQDALERPVPPITGWSYDHFDPFSHYRMEMNEPRESITPFVGHIPLDEERTAAQSRGESRNQHHVRVVTELTGLVRRIEEMERYHYLLTPVRPLRVRTAMWAARLILERGQGREEDGDADVMVALKRYAKWLESLDYPVHISRLPRERRPATGLVHSIMLKAAALDQRDYEQIGPDIGRYSLAFERNGTPWINAFMNPGKIPWRVRREKNQRCHRRHEREGDEHVRVEEEGGDEEDDSSSCGACPALFPSLIVSSDEEDGGTEEEKVNVVEDELPTWDRPPNQDFRLSPPPPQPPDGESAPTPTPSSAAPDLSGSPSQALIPPMFSLGLSDEDFGEAADATVAPSSDDVGAGAEPPQDFRLSRPPRAPPERTRGVIETRDGREDGEVTLAHLLMVVVDRGDGGVRDETLLDTGATDSVCHRRDWFEDGIQPSDDVAIVANGRRTTFDGVGPALGLPKVYYLAGAANTLISMSRLIEDNTFESANDDRTIVFRSRVDGAITWGFTMSGGLWVRTTLPDFRLSRELPDPGEGSMGSIAPPHSMMVFMSSSISNGRRNLIIMDSGATSTICNDINQFCGSLRPSEDYAIVADGKRAQFDGVGCAFGLNRVYYLRQGSNTLISMADLIVDNSFSSEDDSRTIVFRSRVDGSVTWKFVLDSGLWVLAPEDASVHSVFTTSPDPGARASLLHRRLGHCSWRQLHAMVKKGLVKDLKGIAVKDLPRSPPYCRSCAMGKIRRLPFLKVNPHRSTVPGAGWHVDIIVLRIPAIESGRYFLLFTDDCTRAWVGFTMERKSDAITAFKKFHCNVIAHYNLPMVFLKSDRGGEFVSERFSELLTQYGIRQFLVTARDPQANGGAERQGQTLFGDVRCMLIDSGMALSFWSYAAHLAIYCRNRLPRERGKTGKFDISPCEWLTGTKPSIKRIHVFGSHCTYYDDPQNKLLPRGRSARFIGVESDTYYILWDAAAHKIVTRRHVVFRERGPSAPIGIDTEGGGESYSQDQDFHVGVPEEEASDLIDAFHDDEPVEEDGFSPSEAPCLGAPRPVRDFDPRDVHLEQIPQTDDFQLREISRDVATPRETQGCLSSDDVPESDEETVVDDAVGDIIVEEPSNVGMFHPNLLKEVDSSLTPEATEVRDTKRVAPRQQFSFEEKKKPEAAKGVPHATRKEARGRGRPRKNPPVTTPPPAQPVKRGRGRPRKHPVELKQPVPGVKRGRGRPRKQQMAAAVQLPPAPAPKAGRKRERPRKQVPVDFVVVDGVQTMVVEPGTREADELLSLLDRQEIGAHTALSVEVTDTKTGNLFHVPLNYFQAHKRPDSQMWTEAEELEMNGLRDKEVFEWVRRGDIPPHAKILTSRYVYDFKTNENNEILRYKARLVVRGFEQREGLEYGETFSATVRATSIRVILSLAARERMKLHQFDVEQAFLTASVGSEVIYVRPPPGQERPGYVWRLKKALYGLKQASRLFQKHFSQILTKDLGMTRLKEDASIYVMTRRRANGRLVRLFACVYVDDIVVAYGDQEILDEFRSGLTSKIGIKDIGPLKYCLGMHVQQHPTNYTVSITQTGFIQDLLDRTGLGGDDVRKRKTPAPPGEKLSQVDCPTTDEGKKEMMRAPYDTYRSIVGSLLYLTGATRPDIGFAVNQLARFVANPGMRQWNFLQHLLRYLAGTKEIGVHYCGNSVQGLILEDEKKRGYWGEDCLPQPQLISESFHNNVMSYADADWATDPDSRRSTSGWVTMMNGGPLSWRVKRQAVVATSSAESELYSLGDCFKEVRWLQKLLKELGFPQPHRTPGRGGATAEPGSRKNRGSVIFEDNTGCIQISQNNVFHNRTKHVDTQWQFVLQYVEEGYVCVTHVGTKDQVADVMTKNVPGTILEHIRPRLMGEWFRPFSHPLETSVAKPQN